MAPIPTASPAESPSETPTPSPEPEYGGDFQPATVAVPVTVCVVIVLIWIIGAWARRYAKRRSAKARQPDVERDADSQIYLRNSQADDRQEERHVRLATNDNKQGAAVPSIPSAASYKKQTLEARVQRIVEQAFDDVVDRVIEDVVERNLELSVEKIVEDAVQRMFEDRAAQAVHNNSNDDSNENEQGIAIVISDSQASGNGPLRRRASTTGIALHHLLPLPQEGTKRKRRKST